MKILFVIRSTQLFHHYKSLVQELCTRGYDVTVLFDREWSRDYTIEPINVFKKENGTTFHHGWSLRRKGLWRKIIFLSREIRTYRRFLLVEGQSSYYKERWPKYFPLPLRFAVKYIPGTNYLLCTRLVGEILKSLEKNTRPDRRIIEDIRRYAPALVVVGPLTSRFSEEIEYLKAAQALHLPTVAPTVSWDSLTTKELIHIAPDMLLVWNETQVREAKIHHGIPEEHTAVIGASMFDCWFSDLTPSMSRKDFCIQWGIKNDRPYLLYLGSSRNMAHNEIWIINYLTEGLQEVQQSSLNDIQLIVRPHPANFKIYQNPEAAHLTIIPTEGTLPNTQESLQLYYNTLYHALGVVVGVNTSAVIESAIVGKPAIVILTEKYAKTQSATEHFKQLLDMHALELVQSKEAFAEVVSRLLSGEDRHAQDRESFVKKFIRPFGRNISAAQRFADEVEKLVTLNTKKT